MTFRPQTEAELAEMIRATEGPLEIRGGGTRAVGVINGDVLETGALCGVRLYEPAAMTLVVGAGTPLAEVEALLADVIVSARPDGRVWDLPCCYAGDF